jgi:hypothetical protein
VTQNEGERGRRCADAWDIGSTGQRPRERDEEAEKGGLTGGSSMSGPQPSLVVCTARALWPEPVTPRGRRRHGAVAVGRGVSVLLRGTGTGDHRRLIDGTEKMGEREKEVRRGNSPWVGRERWRGCA